MKPVLTPNLPKEPVTVAVSALEIEGVLCINPPALSALPPSMARHADLQLCHIGGVYLLAAPEVYAYYQEKLSPFGFKVLKGETRIGSTYPEDAAYNIARVGNVAFHNPEITDPVALSFFKKQGISVIPVKQGYAKCAVLPIDEKTFITADGGIAKAAKGEGFTVLEITPGGISLPGFSYGFLGGAAGKLSKDTVYITGSLALHPDYKKIFDFLQERGIKIREGRIPIPMDTGSVLPLVT